MDADHNIKEKCKESEQKVSLKEEPIEVFDGSDKTSYPQKHQGNQGVSRAKDEEVISIDHNVHSGNCEIKQRPSLAMRHILRRSSNTPLDFNKTAAMNSQKIVFAETNPVKKQELARDYVEDTPIENEIIRRKPRNDDKEEDDGDLNFLKKKLDDDKPKKQPEVKYNFAPSENENSRVYWLNSLPKLLLK